MHGFELERFAIQLRALDFAITLKFPGENSCEIFVIPLRLSVSCLMFFTKMSPARFVALERIGTHQFRKLEKIGDATGPFERLIVSLAFARYSNVSPKFFAQLRDLCERFP